MSKRTRHSQAVELLHISERLFQKKLSLDDLRQEIARECYPERADFNQERWLGEEFAQDLVESTPVQYRTTLGDSMGALVRPSKTKGLWFKLMPSEEYGNSQQAYEWCDYATKKMFRMWHSKTTGCIEAAGISDHDTISFGDAALSLTRHPKNPALTWMECHHLRDCAWTLTPTKDLQDFHRRFMYPLRDFAKRGWKIPGDLDKDLDKDPFKEVEVRHIVVPADSGYEPMNKMRTRNKQYISVYVCPSEKVVLEENGYFTHPYMLRQWKRHYNSQYSYSPASMLGLIDSRLLQAQGRVLLDAGERAVDPPIIATQEALLSDPMTYAGAITWIDSEYDERLGQAMRPLESVGELPIGLDMRQDTRELLAAAWYINKLNLPSDREMTAYEVGERISEYIRSIGPIAEPFEQHNEVMLTSMFDHMLRHGAFGPIDTIPQELLEQELQFEFEGPVKEAYRKHEAVKARESLEFALPVIEQDPKYRHVLNTEAILRSGLRGIGGDAEWVNSPEETAKAMAQEAQMQEQAMKMEQAQKGAAIAKDVGAAGPNLMQLGQQAQAMEQQQNPEGDAEAQMQELMAIVNGPQQDPVAEGIEQDDVIDAEFEEVEEAGPGAGAAGGPALLEAAGA